MRVYFTDEAEADLEEIADYIALDNPDRAVTFIEELRAKALKAGNAPRAARLRPELGAGLRAMIHRPYLIVYCVTQNQIEVLRIVHGARDISAVLKP